MIIFGQGAIRCHPWLLKELAAAETLDSGRALAAFDRALLGHLGFLLGNLARSAFLGITRGHFSRTPVTGPPRAYYQQLNWMSASFALCADAALLSLGGGLKRKERISARLGDVLSEMYLAAAVLKRFEDDRRPAQDLPLLHWACSDSLYRAQQSLCGLLRNLSPRPLAWLLRLAVFPTGRPYEEPLDHLGSDIAALLLRPSATRNRLTAGVFLTEDPRYREGQIEQAFRLAARLAPIEKALTAARRARAIAAQDLLGQAREACSAGIIDGHALWLVERMATLRRQVVSVDAFADYGRQYVLRDRRRLRRLMRANLSLI
jgi:acyl-CoA dehydrogenase